MGQSEEEEARDFLLGALFSFVISQEFWRRRRGKALQEEEEEGGGPESENRVGDYYQYGCDGGSIVSRPPRTPERSSHVHRSNEVDRR